MAQFNLTTGDLTLENGLAAKLLTFTGALDESNIDDQSKAIYALVEQLPRPILIFDFGELAYLNSKAIGYLTDWHERAAKKNGSIVIVKASQNILDILTTVGITNFVHCFKSLDEAKASLAKS